MAKLTKKQVRLALYNDIITRNKKLFKSGQVICRDAFVRLFNISDIVHQGTYEEVQRSNLKLVQVQMEINQLMRENGLYLKSENYYSLFSVVDKNYTKSTVVRYSAEVDINRACTTRLEAKLKDRTKAGTWGTYNRVPMAEIRNMGNFKESTRHKRTKHRVTQY